MRVLIQRVKKAKVEVDGKTVGSIGKGMLLLVGISSEDTLTEVSKMAEKCSVLRIYEDADEKMNLSLADVNGEILSVSQFTLYADCKKGRRPSFKRAAKPERAYELYDAFNKILFDKGFKVETGKFQTDMKVSLVNDGPVTIMLDSEEI